MPEQRLYAIQKAKDAINEKGKAYVEYMRVVLNGSTFLVPVAEVLGVLRPVSLTPVPMAPDHLMGVANIRGQIYCIIDPGKILHLSHARKAVNAASRFILLRHARVHLGIWAEEVLDLHREDDAVLVEDKGAPFTTGELTTRHGVLPVLRVSALFD